MRETQGVECFSHQILLRGTEHYFSMKDLTVSRFVKDRVLTEHKTFQSLVYSLKILRLNVGRERLGMESRIVYHPELL